MPLYEYECDTNGHRFERIQKYSDPPPEACPTCGSPVHKLFSSPAIQFKGSGFYITDYARAGKSDGGNGQPAKSDGTTASAEGGQSKGESPASSDSSRPKAESKSEAKSESKPESKKSESKSEPKSSTPSA